MATYYLALPADGGLDTNNGTATGTPWATFTRAAAQMVAGDTLFVLPGTYDQGISTFPSGTSWSNKVRIANYLGGTVWLTPSVHLSGNPGQPVRFQGTNAHYIEFDGINMSGVNVGYGCLAFVIDSTGEPHHIRIQNAELIGRTTDNSSQSAYAQSVIEIFGGLPTIVGGFEFVNLTLHGGGRPGTGSFADNGYGIYLACPNCLIDGCRIYDNKGAGIHAYNDDGAAPSNNIIRNNRIYDQTRNSNNGQLWGILISGGDGNQVYNNEVYRVNAENGTTAGGDGIVVLGAGNKLWNNTVTACEGKGIWVYSGSTGTVLQNNEVYANGTNYTNDGTGTVADHNLNIPTGNVNPLFVDAGSDNYRHQSASPCVNTGITVEFPVGTPIVTSDINGIIRPQGPTYDIGAHEYVATTQGALIASAIATSSDGDSVTSASVNTTGATLLVVAVAFDYGATATNLTDSKSNSWTALTRREVVSGQGSRLFYAYNPSVGAGHTFTFSEAGSTPSLAIAAFSGTAITADPFDVQNGTTTSSGSSLATGSVTPSQDNETLVTALSHREVSGLGINSSFTLATSAAPGSSGRTTLFSDTFNRADNTDLNANWDAGYTSCQPLQIVSNTVQVQTTSADSVETVNSVSLPNDQWAQVTLAGLSGTGNTPMVLLRAGTPGANTWYEFALAPTGGSYTSRIVYRLSGVNTASNSENATTWVNGDVLRAEAVGTSLRLYRNDVLLVSLTDANLTSGRCGIKIFTTVQAAAVVDDFSAGEFSGSSWGLALAYLAQSTAAAVNPTWSWSGTPTTYGLAVEIATFKATATATKRLMLMGIGS